MKRFLALGLCMLCLQFGAYAETVSISELRAQTPECLQMTVTTDAGDTVTVDAPITLPGGDTLPSALPKSTATQSPSTPS